MTNREWLIETAGELGAALCDDPRSGKFLRKLVSEILASAGTSGFDKWLAEEENGVPFRRDSMN